MLDASAVMRYSNYINKEFSMQIRTEVAAPELAANGQWRACFNTYMGTPGTEVLSNTTSSPPLWTSEDAAYDASRRALTVLEQTGRWPNMCQPW